MTTIVIDAGAGPRTIDLSAYLDAAREEQAHAEAYAWIKALRHMTIEETSLRSRFTVRGDSLWWFAELYLHKTQEVLRLHRTILAFRAMVDAERPLAVRGPGGKDSWLLRRLAQSQRIPYRGAASPPRAWRQILRLEVRATALEVAARLSRVKRRPRSSTHAPIVAFIHKAFWRGSRTGGDAESYIGPVLREIEAEGADVRYVAVGPRANFRARRWWDPLRRESTTTAATPIEAFAPLAALAESREVWLRRHLVRRALWASRDIRAHAIIHGCDCWPSVREQLAGVALLQFPWSVRSMDEAAAALEALRPRVAVTYAEAGGWGRALALECRRRRVPLVGLQHGFIYRHWLNYRHEADEMAADPANPLDAGFPRPALTLVYDDFAATHLRRAARFPADAVRVTGSPGLDTLLAAVRACPPERLAAVRRETGARENDRVVLVASKEREARAVLPALVDAVRGMDGVFVAIKPHPAETPGVYRAHASASPNVRVVPSGAALPELLAIASAVVTVNSTVAIDALALGIPSLVIGLPNNLTPFVEAGVMAGANGTDEMRAALTRVLYDQEFRQSLLAAAAAMHHPPRSGGDAAARAARAVLNLVKESQS